MFKSLVTFFVLSSGDLTSEVETLEVASVLITSQNLILIYYKFLHIIVQLQLLEYLLI
jgi:hypothetical protein